MGLLCTDRPQTGAQQTRHFNKHKKECEINDINAPGDQIIRSKEYKKITKYDDLTRLHVQKLWNVKVSVVVDALDTVSEELEKWL